VTTVAELGRGAVEGDVKTLPAGGNEHRPDMKDEVWDVTRYTISCIGLWFHLDDNDPSQLPCSKRTKVDIFTLHTDTTRPNRESLHQAAGCMELTSWHALELWHPRVCLADVSLLS
jgi:hypothetical protein